MLFYLFFFTYFLTFFLVKLVCKVLWNRRGMIFFLSKYLTIFLLSFETLISIILFLFFVFVIVFFFILFDKKKICRLKLNVVALAFVLLWFKTQKPNKKINNKKKWNKFEEKKRHKYPSDNYTFDQLVFIYVNPYIRINA